MSDLEALEALNAAYVRAVQESDTGWFEAHLSADFLNTNPDCTLADRAAFLKRIAQPAGVSGLAPHDVRIRLFGDFAVIHAQTRYVKADGAAGTGRYTDIWARRDGRWLCIAAHVGRG